MCCCKKSGVLRNESTRCERGEENEDLLLCGALAVYHDQECQKWLPKEDIQMKVLRVVAGMLVVLALGLFLRRERWLAVIFTCTASALLGYSLPHQDFCRAETGITREEAGSPS